MKFPNLRPNMAEKVENMSALCLLNNATELDNFLFQNSILSFITDRG